MPTVVIKANAVLAAIKGLFFIGFPDEFKSELKRQG